MRPRKIVLCVSHNEQTISELRFMLEVRGYRAIGATSGQEAIGIFCKNSVDLVLADYNMPAMNGDELVGRLKLIAPHIPMILRGDPQKMLPHCADALLCSRTCSVAELLERIKIMAAKKRGPRKGSIRMAHKAVA